MGNAKIINSARWTLSHPKNMESKWCESANLIDEQQRESQRDTKCRHVGTQPLTDSCEFPKCSKHSVKVKEHSINLILKETGYDVNENNLNDEIGRASCRERV